MPYVKLDGSHLEYERTGPASEDAPTLVFLHEGLGSVSQWRDFPASVSAATGLASVTYSRLGYGKSDPVEVPRPLTYMHDEALRTLPAFLTALAIRKPLLVGHSDGASIAIIYAGSHPAIAPLGLVLEARHVFVEDLSIRSIEASAEAFRNGQLRERLARHHGANVDAAFWGWNRAWLDPGFRTWNLEAYLPNIHVPTLVIQSEDDPYGTVRQVEAIERGVGAKVERLLLPECGHAPHRDQPERTREAIVDFVRRLQDGRR